MNPWSTLGAKNNVNSCELYTYNDFLLSRLQTSSHHRPLVSRRNGNLLTGPSHLELLPENALLLSFTAHPASQNMQAFQVCSPLFAFVATFAPSRSYWPSRLESCGGIRISTVAAIEHDLYRIRLSTRPTQLAG
jgi:hypothetical protein